MTETIVVASDGSDAGRRAFEYAHERAGEKKAKLIVVHVLEWSPYSFLTPEEIEERHVRRKQELSRAETAIVAPLVASKKGSGVVIETAIRYGHVIDTICEIATENNAIEIVAGRTGNSGMMSRVFGSVAGSLAQVAPVPCTIVP